MTSPLPRVRSTTELRGHKLFEFVNPFPSSVTQPPFPRAPCYHSATRASSTLVIIDTGYAHETIRLVSRLERATRFELATLSLEG